LELLEESKTWATVDNISNSAAVSACEKCAEWQLSLVLLQNMEKEKVGTNTTSYNAAISACEKGKRWELALELLEESKTWATVDTISCTAAMSACEKFAQWHHMLVLLETMWEDRV